VKDALGRVTTSVYDAASRQTATISALGLKTTQVYDSVNRRKAIVDARDFRSTFQYDAVGNNTVQTDPLGRKTSFSYDLAGRQTLRHDARGVKITQTDNGDRLTRLSNLKPDNTTLSSFRDTWDNGGNRTSRIENNGDRVTWSYDDTYQLTRERRSGANAYDVTYSYDGAGNRRTKLESGVKTTYTCDGANQLNKYLDNTGTTTLTYDEVGNQRTEKTPAGALTTNTWDHERRLTRLLLPSSLRNTMLYRPDNLRVELQDSTGTTRSVWDGQKVVLEADGSNATQAVYSLTDGAYGDLISQRRGSTSSYFAFDPLGSADRLTNSAGAETDSYLYAAFGATTVSTGSSTTALKFGGQSGYNLHADLSAIYARSRYLRTNIGRWTSVDPVWPIGGVNGYRYVKNSPILFTDPSGAFPPALAACFAGMAAGAAFDLGIQIACNWFTDKDHIDPCSLAWSALLGCPFGIIFKALGITLKWTVIGPTSTKIIIFLSTRAGKGVAGQIAKFLSDIGCPVEIVLVTPPAAPPANPRVPVEPWEHTFARHCRIWCLNRASAH